MGAVKRVGSLFFRTFEALQCRSCAKSRRLDEMDMRCHIGDQVQALIIFLIFENPTRKRNCDLRKKSVQGLQQIENCFGVVRDIENHFPYLFKSAGRTDMLKLHPIAWG